MATLHLHSKLIPDFPELPVQLIDWSIPDPWNIPMHSHEFDELLFFQSGGGMHIIESEEIPINDYNIHFIPRNVKHVLNREERSSGFTLAFDRSFLELQLQLFLQSLPFYKKPRKYCYSLKPSAFDRIMQYKTLIRSEIKNAQDYFAQPLFLNYVSTLLLEVSKEIVSHSEISKGNTKHKKIITAFEEYLVKHKNIKYVSQDLICEHLCISPQLLYEICKTNFGKSPKRIVDESIIRYAKHLLMNGNLNAQEVSDKLGFSEASAFSRFFKKLTGISPSMYRQ